MECGWDTPPFYLILLQPFPQAFLEWSKERYTVRFSIYADNIVGKSFEKQ